MLLQSKLIELFYRKGDHAVYHSCVLYEGEEDWSRDSLLYDSAEQCFEGADAENDPDVAFIKLTKRWIGECRQITLCTKADRAVLSVDAEGLCEEESDLLQAFEWMWFDFPTPFRKGDLVESRFSPWGAGMCREPFVLTNLCSWGGEQLRENGYPDRDRRYAWADRLLLRHREGGDGSDMTAHGYFQGEDGGVYYECMHHYLDLAYCREEPKGVRRILKALSSFMQGEIGEDLLVIAYHTLLQEESLRRQREALSCFTDEGLRLAGLK